jgi:hypothetical protein
VKYLEPIEALATLAALFNRIFSYNKRVSCKVSTDGYLPNSPPRIAESSIPIAAPWARYGVIA